eukprot:scaffold11826_cov70-Attheya_sp.AAC.1
MFVSYASSENETSCLLEQSVSCEDSSGLITASCTNGQAEVEIFVHDGLFFYNYPVVDLSDECKEEQIVNPLCTCKFRFTINCDPCDAFPTSPPTSPPTTATPINDPTGPPTTGFPNFDPTAQPSSEPSCKEEPVNRLINEDSAECILPSSPEWDTYELVVLPVAWDDVLDTVTVSISTNSQHCDQSFDVETPDKMVFVASYSNVLISPTCQDNIDYPQCDDRPDTINVTVDCNTDVFVSVRILLYDDDLSAIGSSDFFDLPSQCNLPVGSNSSNYCRYDYRLSCNPCDAIVVNPPGFNATSMPSLSPTTATPS